MLLECSCLCDALAERYIVQYVAASRVAVLFLLLLPLLLLSSGQTSRAEWIHFTLLGIIVPTIKLKVYTFWGL